jgi:hypothetical protein
MENILYLTTAFALLGAVLNSYGYKLSFMIWMLTNLIFAIHNWDIGEVQQAILFSAYLLISINGLIYFKAKKPA